MTIKHQCLGYNGFGTALAMQESQSDVRRGACPRKNRLMKARLAVVDETVELTSATAALEGMHLFFIEQAKPI
jgi:hypothetical protein